MLLFLFILSQTPASDCFSKPEQLSVPLTEVETRSPFFLPLRCLGSLRKQSTFVFLKPVKQKVIRDVVN